MHKIYPVHTDVDVLARQSVLVRIGSFLQLSSWHLEAVANFEIYCGIRWMENTSSISGASRVHR